MLVRCPTCLSKAIIVASEQYTQETRVLYCQCKNLNCSTTFKGLLSFEEIIRSPAQGAEPPCPTKQPDLLKDPRQMDLLACEPENEG
ncbi:ogr/Delta-like zinc finger family protein [Thiomicrorhabdus sp.]|uniref:ogr/Delta-like zinc finger family protein n=1 Tax=Thiomicrorhabdus sp. TaxID=2039724 RepID=UPI003564F27A